VVKAADLLQLLRVETVVLGVGVLPLEEEVREVLQLQGKEIVVVWDLTADHLLEAEVEARALLELLVQSAVMVEMD
jgi:hypothetical protein